MTSCGQESESSNASETALRKGQPADDASEGDSTTSSSRPSHFPAALSDDETMSVAEVQPETTSVVPIDTILRSSSPEDCSPSPSYFDWKELFPELQQVVDASDRIGEECRAVGEWKAWPEKHYTDGGSQDWRVFPFVHTFPAYDVSKRTWITSTCSRCPETAAVLQRIPNIRTALFSRLGGGSRISGHRGWADLANHVLRCHFPLVVPEDGPCGLWVDGEVLHHTEGDMIVFDDSKLHKAFNDSSGDRLVLIIDMLRPSHIPLGTADGGHTPELDAFIDAFR